MLGRDFYLTVVGALISIMVSLTPFATAGAQSNDDGGNPPTVDMNPELCEPLTSIFISFLQLFEENVDHQEDETIK